MLTVVLISLLVVAAIAVLLLQYRQSSPRTLGLPYLPAKTLFSAAERSFLVALDAAVGPAHRVFGKVRVADVTSVKPGLNRSARVGAVNRIASKHFDFVVCRVSDLSVLCAVELNDASHSTAKMRTRDELLSKVCEVIDLPLLQVRASGTYSVSELRSQFVEALGSR